MTNIIESDCVNINGKKRIYLLISKLLVNSNTIPTNKNLGKQTHLCTTKNVEVENKKKWIAIKIYVICYYNFKNKTW